MSKGGGGKGEQSRAPGQSRRYTSLLGAPVPESLPALLPDAALDRVDGLKVILHVAGVDHMSNSAYAQVSRSAGRIGADAYIRERRESQGLLGVRPWVAAVGGEEPMAQSGTGPAPLVLESDLHVHVGRESAYALCDPEAGGTESSQARSYVIRMHDGSNGMIAAALWQGSAEKVTLAFKDLTDQL